jgi:uncharacterized protein (TIGR03435 family)
MRRAASSRVGCSGVRLLLSWALAVMPVCCAFCQTNPPAVTVNPPAAAAGQAPAYEVATIKPWDGTGFALPLRVYIQEAFGIPPNTTGWVIGPDWINSAKYVIQGKPPDSIRDAMKTMAAAERKTVVDEMMQGLLADRFKLKAHWETREMPMYELVLAKGGTKLTENPDASKGQVSVGSSGIRGKAVPIHVLADMLESVPEIGGKAVVDKTGLTGTYDIALKWTPMDATGAGGNGGTAAADEGASIFTAIEEQLGLKLVWTKGPGQVLVIDQIERPSEN